MHLTTKDGCDVVVGVAHIVDEGKRGTKVWYAPAGGLKIEAVAMCSKGDNFSKRVGRRLAADRLLAKMRQRPTIPVEDRRIVFQAICPEYQQRRARRREEETGWMVQKQARLQDGPQA